MYDHGDKVSLCGRICTVISSKPLLICDDETNNIQEIHKREHFKLLRKVQDAENFCVGKRTRKQVEFLMMERSTEPDDDPPTPSSPVRRADPDVYFEPVAVRIEYCMLDVHISQIVSKLSTPRVFILNTRMIEVLANMEATFFVPFEVPDVYSGRASSSIGDSDAFDVILLNDCLSNDLEVYGHSLRLKPGGYIGWCASFGIAEDYIASSKFTCRSLNLSEELVFPILCRDDRIVLYCSGFKKTC